MTIQTNSKGLKISLFILSILFLFLAIKQGKSEDVNGDYHIYWQAGKNFSANQRFYQPELGGEGFVYPPFAAMLFQISALFPFHLSAIIYSYVVNYGLWIFSFFVTFKILKLLFPNKNVLPSIIIAFILSARFYWHNFVWSQANMPVITATLLGIYFYLLNKYSLAYVFLLFGCFFKITPVLFLIYVALKRGYKDWPKLVLLSLPFIALPFIFRGFERGVADWVDFYQGFVYPFAKGKVDVDIISQGIPAFLGKMSLGNTELAVDPVFYLSKYQLNLTILIIRIAAVGLVCITLIYNHFKNTNGFIQGLDFSLIFLLILLLPGRVWEHHHVTMAFVYSYLLVLLLHTSKTALRYIFIAIAFVIGSIGMDTVGEKLYLLSQFYCLITVFMVLLTIYLLILSFTRERLPAEVYN